MMKNPRAKNNTRSQVKSDRHADPIDMLMAEHQRALQYSGILSRAAEQIQEDGFSFEAYKNISDAIAFIDREMKVHDRKEEKFLFPLVAQSLPDETNTLCIEHRELWSALSQLRTIVKDVAEGNIRGTSIIELVKATKNVAHLLKSHIQKENDVYFPRARKLLTPEQRQRLAAEFSEMH